MEQLTSAQGERWKSIRSTFTPIFTSGKMKAMLVYVQETCKKLTNAMEDYAEKDEAFELKELLGKYSMDTIASCAFGVDSQAFTNKDSKFVEYAQNIFKQSAKDGLKLALVMLPFDLGVNMLRLLKIPVTKAEETNFFYEVVLESLKQRRESKVRRNDLIDLMMDAIKGDITEDTDASEDQFEKDAKLDHKLKKGEFDETVIVATAIVMLVAGYDTTGTTLAFACYDLAKNPDVQEKLREEVEEILGDSDRDLTYDDLQSMTYVDQIISETLRFRSPIGLLQRCVEKDYKIPGHDVILKKDSSVWINAMSLHFDPKHYANPNVFDPEHFSKEARAKRNPYAYLPFGQGPRGCIGMRFALMEAKLALANIVRKFNLIPSEKTKEPLELDPYAGIAYVKDGLHVKVEKRY